jgi:alpha-L-rhamnosidase
MVNTYYYFQNARMLSRISGILGHSDDARNYLALSDTIKNELNKKFFNPETNLYASDTTYQTYQLLALVGDIVPEDHREKVFQTLTKDIIETHNEHLNTGIIGTKYLWPVLVNGGRSDLAYTVLTQKTYPGYGYWIGKGATTLQEEWSGKNSNNHQMFGSVDEYLYKYLAGIRSPEDGITSPGYKNIHIQPYVPEGLSFVESSLKTVSGTIESGWNYIPGLFQLKVVIPSNSTALVSIPLLNFKSINVTENGKDLWKNGIFVTGNPGILNATINKDYLNITISSGRFEFRMTEF